MKKIIVLGLFCFTSLSYALEENELDCNEFNFPKSVVCEDIKKEINERLPEGTIKVVNDELLFEISPIATGGIATGHSCSHTAHFRSSPNYFRVYPTIDVPAVLPEVETISELTTNRLSIGVEIDSKVGIKEEWGTRVFGSCVERTTEDSTLVLNYQLNVNTAAAFNLNPVYSIDENGNYVVTIRPKYTLLLDVPLNNAEYDLVGRKSNVIFQDLGNVLGDITTLDFEAFAFDLGLSLVDFLDPNLFLFIGESATEIAVRRALYNFKADHEDNMNNEIAEELDLVDGERTFVIYESRVNAKLASALIPILSII